MHRGKKRVLREVLTVLEMDSSGRTGRQRRTGNRRGPQTGDDLELKESRSWCLRTERGREMGIRWGSHPNVHGNGKTKRKRRDERDGVLTFGQR
jgi:hypothetical protein